MYLGSKVNRSSFFLIPLHNPRWFKLNIPRTKFFCRRKSLSASVESSQKKKKTEVWRRHNHDKQWLQMQHLPFSSVILKGIKNFLTFVPNILYMCFSIQPSIFHYSQKLNYISQLDRWIFPIYWHLNRLITWFKFYQFNFC